MTPTRTRLSADDRRLQLITEAEKLIRTTGFQGFSISALADACGLTRAGVLHHVGSKDRLLIEVLESKERESGTETLAVVIAEGRTDARTILDLLMRRNLERPEITHLFTVLAAESLSPDHPAHDYFAERLRRGAARLTPLLAGSIEEPEQAAFEILSFMDGLQLNWLRDRRLDAWALWTGFADRYLPRPASPTTVEKRPPRAAADSAQ
ncbi:TetR/AcrR family transcriptional regulator [Rathayibacter festucae]|uniref:TetR/AcrR family transcriptional regulator n=1 Tax=Rathayibacter festucae TaxID=110937 RepID=UPI002A6A9C63|nr:TetR family transcriptional regulator [Rathayibacter festucae]MDY0914567.1 TetR family transcriptional regulator [Rathayibacter festucae]